MSFSTPNRTGLFTGEKDPLLRRASATSLSSFPSPVRDQDKDTSPASSNKTIEQSKERRNSTKNINRKHNIYIYITAIVAAILFIVLFEANGSIFVATVSSLIGFNTKYDVAEEFSSEGRNSFFGGNNDNNLHQDPKNDFNAVENAGGGEASAEGSEKHYIFVGGLQRSGTTLLSRILEDQTWTSKMHVKDQSQLERVALLQGKSVEEISGIFKEGGVEGKFIQDVYPYEYLLEIVGKGIGQPSDLVLTPPTDEMEAHSMRDELLSQWNPFWDLSASVFVEKSPENVFLAPLLESLFGADKSTFIFSLRHPLVWAIVIEKWIGPKLSQLASLPQRIELWFAAMDIAAQHARDVEHGSLINLEVIHREDFKTLFDGKGGIPPYIDQHDLNQESQDLIDGSLSYISCWLRGLEYDSCTRRCTAIHAQMWLSLQRSDAAARNRKLLRQYASESQGYEQRANRFGYTFKGVNSFFAGDHLSFDKKSMIHPFEGLSWSEKGCALMVPGSLGCQRATAMDTFDAPVHFKNGILVAAPKLMSISNEKAINGMVQREDQMLKALSAFDNVDVHMIHYDAYVLEDSENLDNFHCPKSRVHTFNGMSTREQYDLAVSRIKRDNVNLVASILIFTTATMNIHKEAHAFERPGGVANPTWFNGPGSNEPIQMMGSWLRQDFGPSHHITIMTDDIHHLRSKKVLEDHTQAEIEAASAALYEMEQKVYGEVADTIMTVSSQDADSIRNMNIDTDMRWLPFIATSTALENIPTASGRSGLLYCASLNPIAAAAVEFLAQQVLPNLPAEYLPLVVVGPYWVENLKNLPILAQSPYLMFTGSLTDEALQQFYDTKRVFVAPLLESTGIATKIINAMSKGVPVVTTALGLNGIGLSVDEAHGIIEVCDDAAGFVDAIKRIATDDALWTQLSTAAAEHVRTRLNEEEQIVVLRNLFEPLPKPTVLGYHAKLNFKEDPVASALSVSAGSYWINPGISRMQSGDTNDLAIAVRLHNGRPLTSDENGAFRWESEVWIGKMEGGTQDLFCDTCISSAIRVHKLDVFPGKVSCDYSHVQHQDESDGPEDPRVFVFQDKMYLFVVSRPMVDGTVGSIPSCSKTMIEQYLVGPININGNSGAVLQRPAVPLRLPQATVVEKNWSPFEYAGKLFASRFVYPQHRVVQIDIMTGACTDVPNTGTESDVLSTLVDAYRDQSLEKRLKSFRVSGGTPAVRVKSDDGDYYMGVMHITRLPKDSDGRASIGRSYDNYAYKFDAKPPFKITGVSKNLVLVTDSKTHGQVRVANTSVSLVTGIALETGPSKVHKGTETFVALSYGVGNSRSYVSQFRLADLEKQFLQSYRNAISASPKNMGGSQASGTRNHGPKKNIKAQSVNNIQNNFARSNGAAQNSASSKSIFPSSNNNDKSGTNQGNNIGTSGKNSGFGMNTNLRMGPQGGMQSGGTMMQGTIMKGASQQNIGNVGNMGNGNGNYNGIQNGGTQNGGMQIPNLGKKNQNNGMQMQQGGMQMQQGGMQMQQGGMQMQQGGMQMQNGGMQMQNGGMQMQNGGMQLKNSGMQGMQGMQNGGMQMQIGGLQNGLMGGAMRGT